MKHNSNVPAFLTKLWTLVEDSDTNEFICWSQEGNSFLVLDEQRFAKEILPKFFKHNNMASFVRQLNMYGFRKVMHLDTGIVKQERDGPVEFQHPYFKNGRDDLLENIKRKVSSTKPEDSKLRQEDLSRILSSVQTVHDKQENMDVRLATLKRENEALWREMSNLRQKHVQQQRAIKELVQFILTLVQNNRVLNLKRKRPLLLSNNAKKSKFISQIFEEPVDHSNSAVSGLNSNTDVSDDVIICDITNEDAEVTVDTAATLDDGDAEIVEVDCDHNETTENRSTNGQTISTDFTLQPEGETSKSLDSIQPTCSSLQLNQCSALSQEDPVKMMDSILNESGTISQNINLLGKVELMDYLDSIDCSLEDFQAMLYGKHFSIDSNIFEESDLNSKDDLAKTENYSADKQLIQYTSCPLLAFLDGCSPLPSVAEPQAEDLNQASGKQNTDDDVDLLQSSLQTEEETPRSSMIRLEPLTEAEASQATLFYMCELNSDLPPADPLQLDV
ncbi:Heat shock factor protein 2 [Bagarius yarrelli]|uniref:Heat shock factor protein 2 n=1 Tax=Bagarius yarrelli TaxID=175774 RepID=A0A556UYP4_BAGYA|nr:Heat shock factor protein 2 [Bagarius yarrelli]